MSEFDDAARGLSRAQQARLRVNWKSQATGDNFAWWELRAAGLMSTLDVPAWVANEETWDRMWGVLSEGLHEAYQLGALSTQRSIEKPSDEGDGVLNSQIDDLADCIDWLIVQRARHGHYGADARARVAEALRNLIGSLRREQREALGF